MPQDVIWRQTAIKKELCYLLRKHLVCGVLADTLLVPPLASEATTMDSEGNVEVMIQGLAAVEDVCKGDQRRSTTKLVAQSRTPWVNRLLVKSPLRKTRKKKTKQKTG